MMNKRYIIFIGIITLIVVPVTADNSAPTGIDTFLAAVAEKKEGPRLGDPVQQA